MQVLHWFERNHKITWAITIIIAIVIFYISSLTFETGTKGDNNFKAMIYHIGIFFFFAFFLNMALAKAKNKSLIFISFILSILYATTDEIHQFFVPGRNMSFSDVILDAIGIFIASTIYIITLKYDRK